MTIFNINNKETIIGVYVDNCIISKKAQKILEEMQRKYEI
jgi:hypothetical protein